MCEAEEAHHLLLGELFLPGSNAPKFRAREDEEDQRTRLARLKRGHAKHGGSFRY